MLSALESFGHHKVNDLRSKDNCSLHVVDLVGVEKVLYDIPNIQHRLQPVTQHVSHNLWNGILVVTEFIKGQGSEAKGWVCDECLRALNSNTLPKLSLANNLWIGNVPHQLAILTLPEQLLVSRHYPRCYVVKLYPRNGHVSNLDHLQRGMVGNVTLYNMNTNSVVEMLEGQLLLQPVMQLASVLAITYVGTKNLPKTWLKSTFRVRRRIVSEALMWLKDNNELYRDIVISLERLKNLPEDDIPFEISATIRHEDDDETVARERAGYVPDVEVSGKSCEVSHTTFRTYLWV